MKGASKVLYMFDPLNGIKTEISWDLLEGITGKNRGNLSSYKSRRKKVSSINCYIIDGKFTKEELYNLMIKENPQDEIWKHVEGTCFKYMVSDYGRVKRIYNNGKEKLLVPYTKSKNRNYLFVKVKVDNKIKELALHRIVAKTFLENESNFECVYHKDENKFNNRANNLEWIDREKLGRKTAWKSKSIAVLKLDPITLEVIDEYASMADAGRCNYLHRETIRQCIIGNLKTAGGFGWTNNVVST